MWQRISHDCVIVQDPETVHFCIIKSHTKNKDMKGKYITTSLLLAVMASEKTSHLVNLPETTATTDGHALIWSKEIPTAQQLKTRLQGRDELKLA